jgi:lipopolysaccharide/colanic/teichoic acid biosynthesis glycosyltransferase
MTTHQHVIDEELFRSTVTRERKRADRCSQPFVLLLVNMGETAGPDAAATWRAAIAGLAAAKHETDVLGWFKRKAVIGVILTDVRASELTTVCEGLDARFRRELAKRLEASILDRLSIHLHVHPEPGPPVERSLPRLAHGTRRKVHDGIKRTLDVLGSLALLLLLSPLLLLLVALVKLGSPGPVLFGQVRIGQMMRPFTILKFRTMYVNNDSKLHHEFVSSFINGGGQAHAAGTNGVFKLTNDPRVTSIGRLLRKTSLDELPQLWNVLRGEMSLVGPRPPLPYELEQYKPWHRRRVLEAKPGITGLWQVAGRSRTTFDDMVRLDLRYASTRSLWTDIKILLATPAAVISGKGAC